jgi:hypothetical protein
LQNLSEYILQDLKDLAKKYGVSLIYKLDDGKWKTLNKSDLYNNIKLHLEKKNKIN